MIRGALIGTGQIALQGHLPAYIQNTFLSRKVQIVAAVDSCADNLRTCEHRLPGVRGYRTFREAFIHEDLDFIDICTPPDVRVDIIREATARGWHILCEKPVATDLRSGFKIRRLLDQRPIMFMPCHQYPFSPLWRLVLQQLKEGLIGEVRLALIEVYRERADPGSLQWCPGWRQRRDIAGGGVLLDIGTHYLHLTHMLFGLPTAVTARTARLACQAHDVEDTAVVILEYPNRLVEMRLSWASLRRETRLHIVGSAGSIVFDGTILRVQCGGRRRLWKFPAVMSKSSYPIWYAQLFRQFFGAILRREFVRQTLDDALNTLRCTEAAYASAGRNQTVPLADFVDVPDGPVLDRS